MGNDSLKDIPRKLRPTRRWEVFSYDQGYWRTGIYKPDALASDDVLELEKHSCPELFICLGGRAGLVIYDGETEKAVEFEPGAELLVSDYHNGFQIDRESFFLVIERTAFSTDYIDRKTRRLLRSVTVE
jgi:hypothetical protein